MSRATVTLKTRDGQTEASVFRPDSGKGPWPAVLVYQDGRGTVYNRAASERHYQTLLALFDATLKPAPPKN
jgi:dienelactone hydrolase